MSSFDEVAGQAITIAEQRIKALMHEQYLVTELLCQALGMTKDPDMGYPIGERTVVDLAMEVRKRLQASPNHGWNWI